ncbi:MAG: SIMPL domain-containing protein [Candidatus Eiseniibacteriota bacterium]
MAERAQTFGAVAVAVGVALAGFFVGQGFVKSRVAERYVTVKGVSERDVEADLALWPIRHLATHDDLATAQREIETHHRAIVEFLARAEIPAESVQLQGLEVEDRHAQSWVSGPVQSRFIVTQTMIVRSRDAAKVRAASQKVGELVDAGVVIAGGGLGPTYLFTRLNDFKPEMIAEATALAREAATQFATDSGSALGGIRRASQGVFEIRPRDRAPGIAEEGQLEKTLRVVTTVEYLLE